MGELLRTSPHLDGVVGDFFAMEGLFASSRTSDLYKAIDREREEAVSLWVSRHPLQLHSAEVDEFLARMQRVQADSPASTLIRSFGIDRTGVAFTVMNSLSGQVIGSGGKMNLAEFERRISSCIGQAESFHSHSIVCGDLSLASFLVSRAGDVQFIGVMGGLAGNWNSLDNPPPEESLHFLAPEFFVSEGVNSAGSMSGDVFALGVLVYRLLTGAYPFALPGAGAGRNLLHEFDLAQVQLPSALVPNSPPWVDSVVIRALDPDPAKRFESAGAMLAGIGAARKQAFDQSVVPSKPGRKEPVLSQRGTLPKVQGGARGRMGAHGADESSAGGPSTAASIVAALSRFKMIAAVILVFVLSAVIGNLLLSKRQLEEPPPSPELQAHRAAAGDNQAINEAVQALGDNRATDVEDLSRKLDDLVRSDDPLSHVLIVTHAIDAPSMEVRVLAEKALVERMRRLGMQRSAEQLRQWLRTVDPNKLPDNYEALLKALNPNLPVEARESGLRESYVAGSMTTLRVATAVALDSSDIKVFDSLLAQLLGDALDLPDAATRSGLALIMAHPDLGLVFGDDVVQRREELPDADVIWLLEVLAKRNDFNLRAFASLSLERNLLSPLRRNFLEIVRDRQDIPIDVVNTLVKAAAGAVQVEDVSSLGRWYDIEAERILLAFLADSEDSAILGETFDMLAGKNLLIEPSNSLVDWIRKKQWDKRAEFAAMVGVLSFSDQVPEQRIEKALSTLDPYVKDPRLTNILLSTNKPVITKLVVDRYAKNLQMGVLLNLLTHSEPLVRIRAIEALRDIKEAGAMTIIIERYEREQDPQVREAYKQNLWYIQQRGEPKA